MTHTNGFRSMRRDGSFDTITQRDLDDLLDEHPRLNVHGYGDPGQDCRLLGLGDDFDLQAARDELRADVAGVQRAADWLDTQRKRRDVPEFATRSRILAHVVGQGTTNGAFIAACLIRDVPLQLSSYNAGVGLHQPRGGWTYEMPPA